MGGWCIFNRFAAWCLIGDITRIRVWHFMASNDYDFVRRSIVSTDLGFKIMNYEGRVVVVSPDATHDRCKFWK